MGIFYVRIIIFNPVTTIPLRKSDPIVIKEAKEIGLRILQNNDSSKRAWRIDYSEFFERYVQYVLKQVAGLKGASLFTSYCLLSNEI